MDGWISHIGFRYAILYTDKRVKNIRYNRAGRSKCPVETYTLRYMHIQLTNELGYMHEV